MSAAPAAVADATSSPKGGKKKLVMIMAIAVLLAAVGGGGALWYMKKRAAAMAAEDEAAEASESTAAKGHGKDDKHATPTFVPLDMFTVNLADRESERYAQVGITLELDDPAVAEQLKAYMPAIRNNILMALAAKTSSELLDREGKVKLAAEIRREAARGLGLDIPAEEPAKAASAATAAAAEGDEDGDAKAKKKKKKVVEVPNPISRVHFSNFIIQ